MFGQFPKAVLGLVNGGGAAISAEEYVLNLLSLIINRMEVFQMRLLTAALSHCRRLKTG
jgi:hypothetical protein